MNSIDNQALTHQKQRNNRQLIGKTRNNPKTKYDYKTPADRYKNAQPLMVPFDAVEDSTVDKL